MIPAAPDDPDHLTFLRVGAFSGSALSLRRALERRTAVRDVNLLPLARSPRLLAARARSTALAATAGHLDFWKSGSWSASVQRHLQRTGVLPPSGPALVVQSVPALMLPPGVRYAVYTDRVGLEGATAEAHASHTTKSWARRERAFLQQAETVFVMGPSTCEVLLKDYRLRPEQVEVVGAGPNVELGPPVPHPQCRRLLFVGIDWERKGGPILLEAFDRLRERRPGVELFVAGGGPTDVEEPPGVRFLGRVPPVHLERLYDSADLLVLPTRMEAFGIVLVEALLKGLPCVHSTVGNQRWIVDDAGLAVPPGDPVALADALVRAVDDYAQLQRRAVERGSRLRDAMSWDTIAGRVLDRLTTGALRPTDRRGGPCGSSM